MRAPMSTDLPFIDGIHNYCDRWCERCPLAARCRVRAAEKEVSAVDENAPPGAEAFWDALERLFGREADAFLDEAEPVTDAHHYGIDLGPPEPGEVEAIIQDMKARDEAARVDPLARAARTYASRTAQWLRCQRPDLLRRAPVPEPAPRAAQPSAASAPIILGVRDAVEVVSWYQFQVGIKLQRALVGDDRDEEDVGADAIQTDANGSAKVSLIGVQRSLAAWHLLRQHLPDQADAILEQMLHLHRLRRGIEARFPDAHRFMRPGFDREGI